MMRSASFLGLALLVIYSFCMFKANAHPEKIDYHSSICQKMSMMAAGGAGGGVVPGLAYNAQGVTSVAGDFSIVCPLLFVTGSDDNTGDDASATTVTVNFTARVTSTSIASACDLRAETGGAIVSIPSFPIGVTTIAGTGSVVLPSTASSSPNGLKLVCTPLKQNTLLGSIQIQVQP